MSDQHKKDDDSFVGILIGVITVAVLILFGLIWAAGSRPTSSNGIALVPTTQDQFVAMQKPVIEDSAVQPAVYLDEQDTGDQADDEKSEEELKALQADLTNSKLNETNFRASTTSNDPRGLRNSAGMSSMSKNVTRWSTISRRRFLSWAIRTS